jgi:hypothetical protein
MDVMDVRVEKAFHRLVENGELQAIGPEKSGGTRLYRSRPLVDETAMSRVERFVLYQARLVETEAEIRKKCSARLRCSNAVRWSFENGKINALQGLFR